MARPARWGRVDARAPARPAAGPRRPARGRRLALATGLAAALALSAAAGRAADAPLLVPKLVIWGHADGATLRQPRGVAFDPLDGAIYVANTGEHRIEIYSRTGRALGQFVHRVTGPDRALGDGEPCALAFDRAGRLLVADNAARYVDVLTRRGRPVTRLDIPAGHPSALAIGVDGTIYVGTTGEESKVHLFRADYTPAGSWGQPGSAPGQLFGVTALGMLPDSTLAVACARTDLGIQVFTPTGGYLRGFGTHELGAGNLSLPSGVLGTSDGRIWVCDEIRQSLQVFDSRGVFLAQAGGRGAAPGEFAYPSALATDGKGLIAVTDRELGRVQVLALPPGAQAAGGPAR